MEEGLNIIEWSHLRIHSRVDYYFERTGKYPESIDDFRDEIILFKDGEKLTDDSLVNPKYREFKEAVDNEPWVSPYYDKFASDSLLRYMPIKIDGEYRHHVWYSVGMDDEDDTKQIIQDFNEGKTDKIRLEVFSPSSKINSYLDIFKGNDILINFPELNWDSSYFEIEYINVGKPK